jgi:hypothetical protein
VTLIKTKVLKTQRDSKSELRIPNSKSVPKMSNRSDRYYKLVRAVYGVPKKVWSTGLVWPSLRKSGPPDLSGLFTGF